MVDTIQDIDGTPVLVCAAAGDSLRGDREAMDLIAGAMHHGARWVVVPDGRLTDDFFRLRSGIAGLIVQKFVNYRIGLAVVGDISRHVAGSDALRDFVTESNRGTQTWFLPDVNAFRDHLAAARRKGGR